MSASRSEAEALVEKGLALYSRGLLEEALDAWRAALARDPQVPRAADYLQYVTANRSALHRSVSVSSASASHTACASASTRRRRHRRR